jgi:hypothetical protein
MRRHSDLQNFIANVLLKAIMAAWLPNHRPSVTL